MRAHRLLAVVAVLAILAALTAGCSGSSRSDSASKSAPQPLVGAAGAAGNIGVPGSNGPAGQHSVKGSAAGAPSPVGLSSPAVDLAVAKRPADDRQVISTAQLEVEARAIDQTVQTATKLVVDAQGYVFSETASLTQPQHAHVVFKVLPAHFDAVVAGIGGLGTLVHREIGTQDVTGQVVDLGARLTAAQTSAARLQQLLATSGSVADLLSVEQQLTTRDAEVDSLSGELAALQAQVDMATITLDVTQPPAHRVAAAKSHHAGAGFTRGLRAGSKGFANTARIVEAALGLSLPFAPVVVLGLAGWWLIRRRAAAGAPTS